MNFGVALDLLLIGYRDYIRLPNWKEDVKIRIQRPDSNSKMTSPYLYIESRYGKVPWIPTQVEITSNNWFGGND